MAAEGGVCPPEWEARLDELCEHFPFAAESHVLRMLWSLEVYFPPCLVRPGRRLPVQGLSEGSLGYLDRLLMLTAAQGQTRVVDECLSESLVFGGCSSPPVSLGPAGDCPCKD